MKDRNINVYCYKDLSSTGYDVPFFCKDDVNAKRKFIIDSNNEGTVIANFVKEFDLIFLGEWDQHSGELIIKEPTVVLHGQQIHDAKKTGEKLY